MATIYKEVPHVVFESGSDQIFYDPVIREEEREILRGLARKLSEYAALPINSVRKEMWKRCNDLQGVKPMVWITELPWNELDGDSGLKLQTTSSFCRRIEAELRQTIYRWEHMQVDMVLEPFIFSPLVVKNSGIGVNFEEDILKTNAENDVVSHHFHIQIRNEEDIEKIVAPVVTHCEKQSQLNFEAYSDIFDGILAVRPRGVAGFWFAPWDDIVRFTGVQEVMMDLVTRPAYVHALVGRLVRVYLESLDGLKELGLLASNNCNVRVGSGAYGYSRELPSRESNVKQVRCSAIWGAATAQIFAGVSPEMHEEFALSYERQWLERFGLSYYGCCEPLDRKIGVLKKNSKSEEGIDEPLDRQGKGRRGNRQRLCVFVQAKSDCVSKRILEPGRGAA